MKAQTTRTTAVEEATGLGEGKPGKLRGETEAKAFKWLWKGGEEKNGSSQKAALTCSRGSGLRGLISVQWEAKAHIRQNIKLG